MPCSGGLFNPIIGGSIRAITDKNIMLRQETIGSVKNLSLFLSAVVPISGYATE